MRKLYWFAAALFLAAATHTAFVLAMPAFTLKRAIARISAESGANAFFVLPQEEQSRLFPAYPPLSAVGVCAFNVSKTPVDLTADMPPGFWTLTIYSSSGEVLYALNDEQSGTGRFTVNLKRAPGLLEMLTRTNFDDVTSMAGWTVTAGEPTGLAVLWQPVVDAALRPHVVRSMSKTICKAVDQG